MKALKYIALLFVLICVIPVKAGDVVDSQIWSDYYLYDPMNINSKFVHRIGTRYGLPESMNNYMIHYRPSYRFKIGPVEPQLGTALFYIDHEEKSNSLELRPWLGIKYNQNIFTPLKFVNLARLEYRISGDASFSEQLNERARLRYQFGLNGTFFQSESDAKMYGLATAETFWNLERINDLDYNLIRLNTGLGLTLNKSVSLELIYTKNIAQAGMFDLEGAYSNLFQFKLRHRLFE